MSTTDLPGSGLLAGRYRLVERLGAGGMSVVWRGFDEVLGRQVAVKVLPPSTSADPSFRRRLRAEAQAAARLTHPHITNVYDYGEATTADGEPVPYVVMELVDGESLAAVLARVRTLPWPTAVRLSAEVAAALASAHSRGIVHRDVTPANVMLTPAGAKVVDFGISALIGENDTDPDGSLMGTPAYLAPERLEGGQVSPATDVYAVGLLIYRMLIGQLPWDVGTTTALLRAHQYVEPEPLPPVEGLPASVEALIGRCLEKRPADRPSSAELASVLAGISAGAPLITSGFDADWEDGEDTFILPSGYPYSGFGPAAAAAALGADEKSTRRPETPTDPETVHPVAAPAVTAPPPSPPATAPPAGPPLRPGAGGPPAAPPAGRPANRNRVRTRRIVVIAATIGVLSALTYGWTAMGQQRGADPAAKTTTGPTVVPASGQCVVSYAVWSDTGDDFKAQVTLANRADLPVDEWNLWFLMNGDQVLSGNGKLALTQDDRAVRVSSTTRINPQRTTTLQITGRYTESNAAPMAFKLNGQTCETYVSTEPGELPRPVEHLSDGQVRLGAPATSPGISIGPGGTVYITPTPTPTRAGPSSARPNPGTSTSKTSTPPGNGGPTISIDPSLPPSVGPPSVNPGVGETTPTTINSPPPPQPVDCDVDFDVCPSADGG
ncbi:protein kinase [Actinoplanes sp. NEAU-A12]|uniref:Protein kinase n=1 Tax=Actinoplanes sandaracinus TaxID=3045177 RepID=A0ABT6WNX8_9ACTN|nr:protein kinase [Actinoplanes sandaracinus]MDI6101418.1 protein kinase [Actinoplanes sandaracinus]